jgi:hypothetical protein
MKALTLHRPWDQLILAGHKPVENRSWSTGHRGDLLIHAGKAYDPRALPLAQQEAPSFEVPDFESSPVGIVGKVTLVDGCSDAASGGTCDCGPWAFPGQYHWKVADPIRFDTPIPCRGFQQLWTPPADVLASVTELVAP